MYLFNLINDEERCSIVGVAFAFISNFWCHVVVFVLPGFALLYRPGTEQFLVPFRPAVYWSIVVVVLLCVVVGASSVFGVF